ncbi:hypothetical protein A20C1_05602 [marine actinobacterium PHSC20C1]|nr:hypothetical protein A20C1_05602 [marine actinobacterium PHSC20C1]
MFSDAPSARIGDLTSVDVLSTSKVNAEAAQQQNDKYT